jgi:hypothetical protein
MTGFKKLPAVFYRTSAGREPVREWLKEMQPADRKMTQKTPARDIDLAVSRMKGNG